jgi:hypothetical protein
MVQKREILSDQEKNMRIGAPPIPREHGAWVILFAPLWIALGMAQRAKPVEGTLLILAVTGGFLARNALGLLLRRRDRAGTGFWLAIYLLLMAGAGLSLLLVYQEWALLTIGLLAGALWGIHSLLLLLPARKRLDRSQWGEILGVSALVLTGPAGVAVMRGAVDASAWLLWAVCALYFSGGIFHVKMWLEAVKHKKDWSAQTRWQVGRDHLVYHVLLLITLLLAAFHLPGSTALLVGLAFLPALCRAFWSWLCLAPQLPPLKRVGILETVYALWFAGFLIAALR